MRYIASKTNISKSSVHRLYHRINQRNQYDESELWETEAGQKWLSILVYATIFIFALKRSDGTTAAQRLFGCEFPDLFEYLVENLDELPQPRKSRKSSKPQTFSLPTVPS